MKLLMGPMDSRYLLAAQGWAELGNYLEANIELENISPKNRVNPDVLEMRWHIYSHAQNWEACLDIASSLLNLAPERVFGWINRSFALRRLNRIQDASDKLAVAAKKFPRNWQIHYNLACYSSLLGHFIEAQSWFSKAIQIEEKTVQRLGIDDPDLKGLWDSMSTTFWKATE